MMLTLQEWNID